jgi:septum formation inhibitor MinC
MYIQVSDNEPKIIAAATNKGPSEATEVKSEMKKQNSENEPKIMKKTEKVEKMVEKTENKVESEPKIIKRAERRIDEKEPETVKNIEKKASEIVGKSKDLGEVKSQKTESTEPKNIKKTESIGDNEPKITKAAAIKVTSDATEIKTEMKKQNGENEPKIVKKSIQSGRYEYMYTYINMCIYTKMYIIIY